MLILTASRFVVVGELFVSLRKLHFSVSGSWANAVNKWLLASSKTQKNAVCNDAVNC